MHLIYTDKPEINCGVAHILKGLRAQLPESDIRQHAWMQLTVPLGILVHLGEVIVKSCHFFQASAMQHNEITKTGFLRSLAQLYMMGLKMNLKRKRETSLSVSASHTRRCHSSFRTWFMGSLLNHIICFVCICILLNNSQSVFLHL